MRDHHVRIGQGERGGYVVEIDGHPVQNVTESLTLSVNGAVSLPVLTLRMVLPPGAPDVDVRALVKLDEVTAGVLQAIGWTPPPEGQ